MLGSTKYIVNKVKTHLVQSYAYYKPVLLDTGATHQFFSIDSSPPSTVSIVNVQPTKNGIQVLLPNHEIIQTTHKANLNLSHLPSIATQVQVYVPIKILYN